MFFNLPNANDARLMSLYNKKKSRIDRVTKELKQLEVAIKFNIKEGRFKTELLQDIRRFSKKHEKNLALKYLAARQLRKKGYKVKLKTYTTFYKKGDYDHYLNCIISNDYTIYSTHIYISW